ncbi:MAG: hypothetical protein RI988_728 [Pseudomonadota bacterium]|jgi:hypothetical protein
MTTDDEPSIAQWWNIRLDCLRLAYRSDKSPGEVMEVARLYLDFVRSGGPPPTSESPADGPKAGKLNGPGNPGQASDMAPRKRQ